MNQEKYEHLVMRLEQEARESPVSYKVKLSSMAAAGYAYLIVMLLVLVALLAYFGWMILHKSAIVLALKLGIVIGPLAWAIAKVLFMRWPPPEGKIVARRDAPALFDLIEQIRVAAAAPQVHAVLVTGEFNAAVVQHSRLGVFGWTRNYLILGLPLMQGVSLDEFRAVVAHEFGHLSGAHGKFGAWIYRIREGWSRLAASLNAGNHWGRFLFVPFFNWYAPTFAAYSFVQARRQEYEADRISAAVASPCAAASALVRVEVQARFFQEDYWQRILREARTLDRPQAKPFSGLRHAFIQNAPVDGKRSLEAALKLRTGCDDTHPCLKERLHSLGVEPSLPEPLAMSAAETLLGAFGEKLAAEFDNQWHETIGEWWQARHAHLSQSQHKLAELDSAADAGDLSVEDAYERAELTEELVDEAQAITQFESIATWAPDHAMTQFALGRLKLRIDDESGLTHLAQASRINPELASVVCSISVGYFHRHGRNEEARPYLDEMANAAARDAASRSERSMLAKSDTLLPHNLSAEVVASVSRHLEQSGEVRRAWLARKQTKVYPDKPMYVVAIQRRSKWWRLETASTSQKLVQRLINEISLPGDALMIAAEGENRKFRRKFRKVAGSLVYERKSVGQR